MELKECFEKVMQESINMALATSVEDKPNVRVVTFAYDKENRNKLFFSTFQGNTKTKEFEKNPNVSCTPLPITEEGDLQVRIFGSVRKSDITMEKFISLLSNKIKNQTDFFKEVAHNLDLYEIDFTEAHVTVGVENAQILKL